MNATFRVAIRADGSPQLGTGHIVRCLTLADELRQHGDSVVFVACPLPAGLGEQILAHGHELATIAAGTQWQRDFEETAAALGARASIDWMIVDHYALDARWESSARDLAARVMVIDDLADRPHECDILLDQNYYDDLDRRYDGLVPPACCRLLGPRYALLRQEFALARMQIRDPAPTVGRIFVCFGGIDAGNQTAKAIRAIQSTRLQVGVDVVVGSDHPHRHDVSHMCESDSRFKCHCQPDDMAQLMARADLAIGACGTMAWERCALGLPSLVMVLAANQARAARDLARAGGCVNLGEAERVSAESLKQAVLALVADHETRRRLAAGALALMPRERVPIRDFLRKYRHD